jgi:hypothetical protein
VIFSGRVGQYVRFVACFVINGEPSTRATELNISHSICQWVLGAEGFEEGELNQDMVAWAFK